jgi:hypothetical protein
MTFLAVLVCLLVASPAFSQTAGDLLADRGPAAPSGLVKLSPAKAAAILAPNQFQLQPALPPGPRTFVLRSSPTAGPFGEFREFAPARRLDGTLLSDPQWGATTYIPYGGWRGGHAGGGSRGRSSDRRAGAPAASQGRGRR